IISMGLFATPVAYPFSSLGPTTRLVVSIFNPLAPVIDAFRRTVLLGKQPSWLLGVGAISATVTLTLGYLIFKKLEIWIADYARRRARGHPGLEALPARPPPSSAHEAGPQPHPGTQQVGVDLGPARHQLPARTRRVARPRGCERLGEVDAAEDPQPCDVPDRG